jgi:hypothetical protein
VQHCQVQQLQQQLKLGLLMEMASLSKLLHARQHLWQYVSGHVPISPLPEVAAPATQQPLTVRGRIALRTL